MKLGDRLTKLRKEKNKTQLEMSNLVGVSQQTYQKYEKKDVRPGDDILITLCDYFDVSLDYLLGRQLKNIPINIASDNEIISMPVTVFGFGGCGRGKDNNDFTPTEMFSIPSDWLKGNTEDYALGYACGDSMVDAHIIDGALLLFKRQSIIENNQIGLFYLNGEELIKKYKKLKNSVLLVSCNDKYEDIEVTLEDDFEVRGKLEREIILYN